MWSVVALLVVSAVLIPGAVNAGYNCASCNKVRDSEEACNSGAGIESCSDDEVCTTDVRCDGRGRLLFIKGCQPTGSITALDTLLCHDDFARCSQHCNGAMCNLNAPSEVWTSLHCYDGEVVEPPQPTCKGGFTRTSAGPDIVSFSGATYNLDTQNKFVVLRTLAPNDHCQFQVRAQLEVDLAGVNYLSWVGVAFGIHASNADDFDKNFSVSKRNAGLQIRGRGYSTPMDVTPGTPFVENIGPNDTLAGYDNGDGTYTITASADDCSVQLKYREGPVDDFFTLTLTGYQPDNLTGLCADQCYGYAATAAHCVDGAHQNPSQ